MASVYDYTVSDATGGEVSLADYKDKLLLIVNVASKCGMTPQYEGLETLYLAARDRGLEILGFPSNQFFGQEPGTDEQIQAFCRTTYDVTFPVFAKIDVNGPQAAPLYAHLRAAAPRGEETPGTVEFLQRIDEIRPGGGPDDVRWNFTKFLVGRDGTVIKRYEPPVTPAEIQSDLERYL